jgi:hypothetical protein
MGREYTWPARVHNFSKEFYYNRCRRRAEGQEEFLLKFGLGLDFRWEILLHAVDRND